MLGIHSTKFMPKAQWSYLDSASISKENTFLWYLKDTMGDEVRCCEVMSCVIVFWMFVGDCEIIPWNRGYTRSISIWQNVLIFLLPKWCYLVFQYFGKYSLWSHKFISSMWHFEILCKTTRLSNIRWARFSFLMWDIL